MPLDKMLPRERVMAALRHQPVDRVPRFEIWIDALMDELGIAGQASPHAALGQDCVHIPIRYPSQSRAWKTGVDEWGRIWREGKYVGGAVTKRSDIQCYTPPLSYAETLFDRAAVDALCTLYPHHVRIFGTHIGPFTSGYMAMGFEHFFSCLVDNPGLAQELMEVRTEWCIALYRQAVKLGAEVLILADDAGGKNGPMISPGMWRKLVFPLHRRIVEAVQRPVIWHSDGNIEAYLPAAIEAGIVAVHGLDPLAGMDLARIKRHFGKNLALVGNLDNRVLFGSNLNLVREEVDRCLRQGSPGSGYLLATCNSICEGMNPVAVAEFFRFENAFCQSGNGARPLY